MQRRQKYRKHEQKLSQKVEKVIKIEWALTKCSIVPLNKAGEGVGTWFPLVDGV